jgi:hypothetical protein
LAWFLFCVDGSWGFSPLGDREAYPSGASGSRDRGSTIKAIHDISGTALLEEIVFTKISRRGMFRKEYPESKLEESYYNLENELQKIQKG